MKVSLPHHLDVARQTAAAEMILPSSARGQAPANRAGKTGACTMTVGVAPQARPTLARSACGQPFATRGNGRLVIL